MDDISCDSSHASHNSIRKNFLFYIVPYLSRMYVNKTNGENVWTHPPEYWPEELGKWKNPTSTEKDNCELLKKKFDFLKLQILPDKVSDSVKKAFKDFEDNNMTNVQDFMSLQKFQEKLQEILENASHIKRALSSKSNPPAAAEVKESLENIFQLFPPDTINIMSTSLSQKRQNEHHSSEMPRVKRKRKMSTNTSHLNSFAYPTPVTCQLPISQHTTAVSQQPAPVYQSTTSQQAAQSFQHQTSVNHHLTSASQQQISAYQHPVSVGQQENSVIKHPLAASLLIFIDTATATQELQLQSTTASPVSVPNRPYSTDPQYSTSKDSSCTSCCNQEVMSSCHCMIHSVDSGFWSPKITIEHETSRNIKFDTKQLGSPDNQMLDEIVDAGGEVENKDVDFDPRIFMNFDS